MALFVVVKPNPYFKLRTFVEEFDDGVQEAVMYQDGNRASAVNHKGLIFPMHQVRPFLMRVQSRGLDK